MYFNNRNGIVELTLSILGLTITVELYRVAKGPQAQVCVSKGHLDTRIWLATWRKYFVSVNSEHLAVHAGKLLGRLVETRVRYDDHDESRFRTLGPITWFGGEHDGIWYEDLRLFGKCIAMYI